jgi:hypothetical protein
MVTSFGVVFCLHTVPIVGAYRVRNPWFLVPQIVLNLTTVVALQFCKQNTCVHTRLENLHVLKP